MRSWAVGIATLLVLSIVGVISVALLSDGPTPAPSEEEEERPRPTLATPIPGCDDSEDFSVTVRVSSRRVLKRTVEDPEDREAIRTCLCESTELDPPDPVGGSVYSIDVRDALGVHRLAVTRAGFTDQDGNGFGSDCLGRLVVAAAPEREPNPTFVNVTAVQIQRISQDGLTKSAIDGRQGLQEVAKCLYDVEEVSEEQTSTRPLKQSTFLLDITDAYGIRSFELFTDIHMKGNRGEYYESDCLWRIVSRY